MATTYGKGGAGSPRWPRPAGVHERREQTPPRHRQEAAHVSIADSLGSRSFGPLPRPSPIPVRVLFPSAFPGAQVILHLSCELETPPLPRQHRPSPTSPWWVSHSLDGQTTERWRCGEKDEKRVFVVVGGDHILELFVELRPRAFSVSPAPPWSPALR
jgi:hypothetical protein